MAKCRWCCQQPLKPCQQAETFHANILTKFRVDPSAWKERS